MTTHKDHTFDDFNSEAKAESELTITIGHVDDPHDVWGARNARGKDMAEQQPPYKGWLGNPYKVSDHGRETCIEMFEEAFVDALRERPDFALAVTSLTGRVVACYCRHADEDEPACHLDVVRDRLLDGTVFGIAHHGHEIPLTDAELEIAKSPEEILDV